MKTEYKLFIGLGIFMAPLGILYGLVSGNVFAVGLGGLSETEEAGSILLVVCAIAFFFVGFYLKSQSKRMNGVRPEDYNAEPSDGAGPVGSFPVGSIWPFVGAMGATLASLGVVFNGFLAVPGIGMILFCIVGMARESYGGEFHHEDLDANVNPDAEFLGEFTQSQVKK